MYIDMRVLLGVLEKALEFVILFVPTRIKNNVGG
jgi:hypothetical protein